MAQTMPLEADRAAARQRMKLDGDIPVFALLPGSRVSEIDYMAPIFFQTAKLILQRYPDARFLLPVATHATRNRLTALLAEERFKHLPIQLMTAHADLACTAADAVLVTSGTATLEVALCKRPMVISYKISPLTYAYVKRKIKVPHVGLPNILLGREAVPELLQSRAKPQLLADALIKWYESPEECAALQRDFHELHHMLRRDTAELAAQNVLEEAGAL
jgi:lipid-A-disaccharide synthetase